MGRKSKLTNKQWAEIEKRSLQGEGISDLAREFGVDRAAISRRVSQQNKTINRVANQIVDTDRALKSLPISQQIATISLADDLRAITENLASAAKYGAMTAHRLSGIANAQVDKIDDVDPLLSKETLTGIAILTKVANDSSMIGMNLLKVINDVGAVKEIRSVTGFEIVEYDD
jgi:hypothetical protein